MNTSMQVETISLAQLSVVTGAGFWRDLYDAGRGAINIVSNPIGAAARGINAVAGARQQGYGWGESFANGLVQAADTMDAPNLARVPRR